MRICYLDKLSSMKVNETRYWLGSLEAHGEVFAFDTYRMKSRVKGCFEKQKVKRRMKDFSPTHIHFGGNAKNERNMPTGFVKWVRENFKDSRITFFYSDGYSIEDYYSRIEDFVDEFFLTTTSFLKNDKYKFMLYPAPAEMERSWQANKSSDLVFIGNNYNRQRFMAVDELRDRFGIKVFGDDWPRSYNAYHVFYDKDYADICSKSWIVMADPAGPVCMYSADTYCVKKMPGHQKGYCRNRKCEHYEEMTAYVSNRTTNTMMACAVHLIPYVKGIEDYFDNWKDLVWYHSTKERDEIIRELLSDPEKCRQIAVSAVQKARGYTFDRAVKRILGISGDNR